MKLEDGVAQEEIFRTQLELQLIVMETDTSWIWIAIIDSPPFAVVGSVKEAKPVEMVEQNFEKLLWDVGKSGPTIYDADIKDMRTFHDMTVQTNTF